MPSIKENFDSQFVGMNIKLNLYDLAETIENRKLFPMEKLWVETLIFNEMFLRLGYLVPKFEADEIHSTIFKSRIDKDTFKIVGDIYKQYKKKLELGVSNPKMIKSFRMLALLQNFEETYSSKWLDTVYGAKVTKGDRYQTPKFRPIIKFILIAFATPGVEFTIDKIEKEQLLQIIDFLKYLQGTRSDGGIEW